MVLQAMGLRSGNRLTIMCTPGTEHKSRSGSGLADGGAERMLTSERQKDTALPPALVEAHGSPMVVAMWPASGRVPMEERRGRGGRVSNRAGRARRHRLCDIALLLQDYKVSRE